MRFSMPWPANNSFTFTSNHRPAISRYSEVSWVARKPMIGP